MKISVEFKGGLDDVFVDKIKQVDVVDLEDGVDMNVLFHWMQNNLAINKPELFLIPDDEKGSDCFTVRPGILVFINDCDWELLLTTDYQLRDGDDIVFISTLHGG